MIIKNRITLLAVLALLGCGAAVCVSRAQTNSPAKQSQAAYWGYGDANQPASAAPQTNCTSESVRTLFISILIVIVLGTIAIYVAKKLLPKITAAKGRHIAVMETVQLAPNRAVHLVQVGSQRFLLGS
jgi:hypothetical protein